MHRILLCLAIACSGGGDDTPVGDDDDDVTDTDLTPWDEVVTTQEGTCCRTVTEAFEWTLVEHEGLPAMWAVPDAPVGALVVFHGTNGSLPTVQQAEWVELYNLLYPRGIAIIATISSDRDAKQWDLTEGNGNVDYPRVESLLALIDAETPFELDMPLVSIGFSQGCSFAQLFAELGPIKGRNVVGASVHNAGVSGPYALPTLFVSAENDGASARMPAAAADHPDGTLLRGTEVPVDPRGFAKLNSFTAESSERLFDQLVELELIDTDGVRTVDLGDDPEVVMEGIENAIGGPSPADVAQQLRVAWALHRFSAQNKVAEAQWIEAQILGP